METVGDAEPRHAADDVVHHVARAGHHEPHVGNPLEDLGGRLDEVVGAFLVGDASQEGHDLVGDAPLGNLAAVLGEAHGVVHRDDLFGGNAVAVDDDVAREVRNGDHAVGGVHAGPLDGVDLRVDVLARAVVLRGVHVHHQRLPGDAFGGDARVVGQPVVGVDHVELSFEVPGHLRGDHGVARHLLHEVGTVLAREGVALFPGIGRRPGLPPRLDVLLVVGLVLLGGDIGDHVRVDVDERHLLQNVVRAAARRTVQGLHVAGVHDVRETLVLVAVGVRDDESDVYAVARQSAGHSVAGRSQPACNVGRKLPSEH